MLKLLVVAVLSFASVGAAANAAKPLASEVFANSGALSVAPLSTQQMQESEADFAPLGVIALWGLGAIAAHYFTAAVVPPIESVAKGAAENPFVFNVGYAYNPVMPHPRPMRHRANPIPAYQLSPFAVRPVAPRWKPVVRVYEMGQRGGNRGGGYDYNPCRQGDDDTC